MSSKICNSCGHSCHCRDVCTVRTDENETVSACECNDCRCTITDNSRAVKQIPQRG